MNRAEERTVFLRVMHPSGIYPEQSFIHSDAVFLSEPEFVLSVTRVEANVRELEGFGSELSWASVAEIQLWGAVTLSIPEGSGIYHAYPSPWSRSLDPLELPAIDLGDADCLDTFKSVGHELTVDRFPERYTSAYTRHEHPDSAVARRKLYHALSARDPLLLRGVSCLMKGWVLWEHDLFREEAALSVFIAMEAALDYLRHALGAQAGQELSYEGVHRHLANTMHLGEPLSQYLKMCWDNRVMLAHPNSRQGCYAIPPLIADDFYETYEALVSVYRFILIGEDRPKLRS